MLLLTFVLANFQDSENQLIICSATFCDSSRETANDILAADKWEVNVGRLGSTHANIIQTFIQVEPAEKLMKLHELLMQVKPGKIIIFVSTKMQGQKVDDFLFNKAGLPSTFISSDQTQREREDAM